MTRRDQAKPTTSNLSESAVFVGAVPRLSRDGRWLLHFLPGGQIVCRSVADYRRLLAKKSPRRRATRAPHHRAGKLPTIVALWAPQFRAYLPLLIRIFVLILTLTQAVLARGPRADVGVALGTIRDWLFEGLANADAGGR